eukprot:GHVR01028625.1.p1 GENE.GHVR01028625.1~~GHVR01028625.1.p1  ORF type:complete len:138 (+),score=101.04 GHVR01028625.1:95-508(+)
MNYDEYTRAHDEYFRAITAGKLPPDELIAAPSFDCVNVSDFFSAASLPQSVGTINGHAPPVGVYLTHTHTHTDTQNNQTHTHTHTHTQHEVEVVEVIIVIIHTHTIHTPILHTGTIHTHTIHTHTIHTHAYTHPLKL